MGDGHGMGYLIEIEIEEKEVWGRGEGLDLYVFFLVGELELGVGSLGGVVWDLGKLIPPIPERELVRLVLVQD